MLDSSTFNLDSLFGLVTSKIEGLDFSKTLQSNAADFAIQLDSLQVGELQSPTELKSSEEEELDLNLIDLILKLDNKIPELEDYSSFTKEYLQELEVDQIDEILELSEILEKTDSILDAIESLSPILKQSSSKSDQPLLKSNIIQLESKINDYLKSDPIDKNPDSKKPLTDPERKLQAEDFTREQLLLIQSTTSLKAQNNTRSNDKAETQNRRFFNEIKKELNNIITNTTLSQTNETQNRELLNDIKDQLSSNTKLNKNTDKAVPLNNSKEQLNPDGKFFLNDIKDQLSSNAKLSNNPDKRSVLNDINEQLSSTPKPNETTNKKISLELEQNKIEFEFKDTETKQNTDYKKAIRLESEIIQLSNEIKKNLKTSQRQEKIYEYALTLKQASPKPSNTINSNQINSEEAEAQIVTAVDQSETQSSNDKPMNMNFQANTQSSVIKQNSISNPTTVEAKQLNQILAQEILQLQTDPPAQESIKELYFQLHPKELGNVAVKIIKISDHHMQIKIYADSQESLSILEKEASSIKERLIGQNIEIDDIEFIQASENSSREDFNEDTRNHYNETESKKDKRQKRDDDQSDGLEKRQKKAAISNGETSFQDKLRGIMKR